MHWNLNGLLHQLLLRADLLHDFRDVYHFLIKRYQKQFSGPHVLKFVYDPDLRSPPNSINFRELSLGLVFHHSGLKKDQVPLPSLELELQLLAPPDSKISSFHLGMSSSSEKFILENPTTAGEKAISASWLTQKNPKPAGASHALELSLLGPALPAVAAGRCLPPLRCFLPFLGVVNFTFKTFSLATPN